IWITDEQKEIALSIPPIRERIENVKLMRLESSKDQTRKFASTPYKFAECRHKNGPALLIPSVSSENRTYIPMEFHDKNTVSSNANFAAYDMSNYLFSLLTSRLHTLWVGTVGGRLKSDYRYSNTLCYNTFPIPTLTDLDKEALQGYANRIIRERVMNGETLAQLYDKNRMPESLKKVHQELDVFVDSLYQKAANRSKVLTTDTERLEVLFKLYAEMKEQQ
ncbi:type IIL restriction-modification enzyme MmeI, partial [Vibrio scophthalmi]